MLAAVADCWDILRMPEVMMWPCRYELMWTAIVYVWPKTPMLQFRACLCVLLLAVMRLLNLAVPILYRNMVNILSDAAIAASSGEPSSWQPTFWNVSAPLVSLSLK